MKHQRFLRAELLAGLFLTYLAAPLMADSITFSLLPADGNVAGSAGSAIGWGYSITNNSDTDWFVSTDLSPDSSFSDGTPSLLFDFPNVAPDTTTTEAFDPINGIGLYEFAWDLSAPGGDINSGNFVLSGEWWDGDPLNGGNFIADAIDTSAAYTATVSSGSSSTPEPASAVMMLTALGTLLGFRKWHRCA